MGLSAAELRRHVEYGRSFRLDSRQPAESLCCQARQTLRQIGPFKEPFWILVINRSPTIANLIEMNGKFRRIQRPPLAQILARGYHLKPRFQS